MYDCEFLQTNYVSRKLTAVKQRWEINEIVTMAIVWSVQKLSKFLLGKHLFSCTEDKGLTIMASDNVPKNKSIFRWALLLQQFSYTILPLPVDQNMIADYLSHHQKSITFSASLIFYL